MPITLSFVRFTCCSPCLRFHSPFPSLANPNPCPRFCSDEKSSLVGSLHLPPQAGLFPPLGFQSCPCHRRFRPLDCLCLFVTLFSLQMSKVIQRQVALIYREIIRERCSGSDGVLECQAKETKLYSLGNGRLATDLS